MFRGLFQVMFQGLFQVVFRDWFQVMFPITKSSSLHYSLLANFNYSGHIILLQITLFY